MNISAGSADLAMELAETAYRAREVAGLTQVELARKVGHYAVAIRRHRFRQAKGQTREGAQPMSAGSHTVRVMNANTTPAAKPPQPGSAEHHAAWLDRYGDDYTTDDERRAAYQDFQTNLATMQTAFGPQPGAGEL